MPLRRNAARTATTLHDVAREAGVSVATVSRVFNDASLVSPQTSLAVRAAAASLGFRLNPLGRALRAGQTRAVGVLLPTLLHPVFAHCLGAIEAVARSAGHSVSFAATGYDPQNEEQASELLLQQRVDGLLLTVADATRSQVLEKLEREGKPFVLLYNQPSGRGRAGSRPSVSVDNRSAARHMVEHLIDLGHRRIAMLCGAFRQSDRARLRFHGYREALKRRGLPALDPVETPFMAGDLRPLLQDLMGRREAPTAWFCSSDHLALMAIRDLRRLGLSVPRDVSVAGFDGVPLGELVTPELTTVVQPTADIATTGFDLLRSLMGGERYSGCARLHHTLRLGGSVASRTDASQRVPKVRTGPSAPSRLASDPSSLTPKGPA